MSLFLNLVSESAEVGVIDRLQGYAETAEKTIAQQQIADPDYWSSVGIITLTGLLVVFVILAVLILFFMLLGAIFKSIDNSKKKKSEASEETKAAEPVQAAVEDVSAEAVNSDDELIAVISAAVAAYTDGEGFTIKSVRKHEGKRVRSAWSAAGITENTRPF